MMLSLPEDWNYTTRGLAKICKEGVDAIGAALRELEAAGYIVRHKLRDRQGRISDTEYVIYEQPKHGQPLEKIVGNILKVAVIRPKQRPYQTNNFYAVLKRQEMLDKEVYDIVHRNKKMAASDVRKNRGKNCAAGKDKEKAVPRR